MRGRSIIAALLIGIAGLVVGNLDGGAENASPPLLPLEQLFGGPFELVDHDGRLRTQEDFYGRHALIYFGYTYCPDICPTGLQEIIAALDALGARGADVQPLFVSIDPGRDTPQIMADYVMQFSDRLIGLTGTEAQVRAIARAYKLHRVQVVPEWSQSDDDYLVDHSSLTYLLGPDGKVLTLFPHNTPAETIAARTRTYLAPADAS